MKFFLTVALSCSFLFANSFPQDFLWGTAIAEFQNSGAENCPNSNWTQWEKMKTINGRETIVGNQESGSAADFYHDYKTYIDIMKEKGLTSFRFSIDWSLIEPKEKAFDPDALAHYKEILDYLNQNGIEPMVTLHHFTHPQWFEKKGGFIKEANIEYFVRFAKHVYTAFKDKAKLWVTFNEPAIFAFMGYFVGDFPPGQQVAVETTGQVLKNLIHAHIKTYHALKKIPGGENNKIGLVHNRLEFKPYTEIFKLLAYEPWRATESAVCEYLSNITHWSLYNCLKTGHFVFAVPSVSYYVIPTMVDIRHEFKNIQNSYDFIGLNYYSHARIRMLLSVLNPFVDTHYSDEVMTDYHLAITPESFYEAIKEMAELKKPIYITENGIADKQDLHRKDFINSYLSQLEKCLDEKIDVRGYYYWTLIDNFEWHEGYNICFGLFQREPKKWSMRPGSQAYFDFIKSHK